MVLQKIKILCCNVIVLHTQGGPLGELVQWTDLIAVSVVCILYLVQMECIICTCKANYGDPGIYNTVGDTHTHTHTHTHSWGRYSKNVTHYIPLVLLTEENVTSYIVLVTLRAVNTDMMWSLWNLYKPRRPGLAQQGRY